MGAALFLDRDGVINADSASFIKAVEEWQPLPGSLEAIARLTRAGFEIVVLTNQSGIARGLLSDATLEAIHREMLRQVTAAGGKLAGVFHCPHDAQADCACRKPRAGLVDQACRELGLDPLGAPFVGDRASDLEAARAAGCRPIFLSASGKRPAAIGVDEWSRLERFPDLASCADRLIREAVRSASK